MRPLLFALSLLVAGCALVEPDREGPAVLTGRVVSLHDAGIPARLTVYDPHDYRRPLAEAVAEPDSGRFRIEGLPEGAVDVVIEAEGYFPQKYAGLVLKPGENTMKEHPAIAWFERVPGAAEMMRVDQAAFHFGWVRIALKGAPVDSTSAEAFVTPYGRMLSIKGLKRFPWQELVVDLETERPDGLAASIEALLREIEALARDPEVSYVEPYLFFTPPIQEGLERPLVIEAQPR